MNRQNSLEIDLVKTGTALYGSRWKAPLAAQMGVSRETVSRWVSGKHQMPLWAYRSLALILRSRGAILSLCDRTGNIVRPWAEAGFECLCIDIQHQGIRQEGNITYICADLRQWLPPPRRYAMVFSFPPCTNLAVSGAAWFLQKGLGGLAEGVELVEACRRISVWAQAPWMLENPVGVLSSYWRKPDYMFNPCDYGGYLDPPGDTYTKKTCLWTGDDFVMPEKKYIYPSEGSKLHNLPPSPDRGDKRSITPKGFALAVMLANARETKPL